MMTNNQNHNGELAPQSLGQNLGPSHYEMLIQIAQLDIANAVSASATGSVAELLCLKVASWPEEATPSGHP